MKRDPALPSSPSWQALLVVCKDCQKRGSGPKRLKAKDVVREARGALKAERPRPRVVVSGCLGLCPKRSVAVARVDAADGARIMAVETARAVRALAAPARKVSATKPAPAPAELPKVSPGPAVLASASLAPAVLPSASPAPAVLPGVNPSVGRVPDSV